MKKSSSLQPILFILFLCSAFSGQGQLAPDFAITDSDGQSRMLYADYLNQGKTVLIEIFFTTCPPCNAIAPYMEPLYQEWGAGDFDVEFFDLSDKNFDTNVLVNNYKANHGHTYIAAGSEGGSLAAVAPYKAGMFGVFTGTPTFIVIAPNGTVQFDVDGPNNAATIAAIDEAIAATGAVKPVCVSQFVESASFCDGESVTVNGVVYNAAGVYMQTLPGSGGECDSVYTITITELPLISDAISASYCTGSSVVVHGIEYDDPGIYLVTVPSQTSGCDTLLTITITEQPLHQKLVNASFVQGDSVLVYGVWYAEADVYFVIVPSTTGGCDTLATLNITELPVIPEQVTISGVVRTAQGSVGIAGAYVIVTLDSVEIARDTTDALGRYEFTFDSTYVVSNDLRLLVEKSLVPANGVSVLDLLVLQKHLLGLENINSVEKLLAADLNRSGALSVLDVLYFRQFLLGIQTGFPTSATWLFFHESLSFGPPGPQPPVLGQPVPVVLSQILAGTQSGTFRGIKIGDLNNSANPLN